MALQDSITYINDLDISIQHSVGIERLKGATVLITGATGTIGSFIADTLLRYNQNNKAGITVYVAGRDVEKLVKRYSYWNDSKVIPLKYDVSETIGFDCSVDYVMHAAGNAHPAAFNGDPVGTIIGNVQGTYNLLEYSRLHGSKRFLYVSSGEVYGQGDLSLEEFSEEYSGYIDTSSPRSCYPQSKRATENLCASYYKQYGLETVTVRPCHTFGPGITPTDSRANAQFFRNVLNDEDIVMKSAGTQLRSYNYVADCISGVITILLNGVAGEAYNTANPNVRISIAELAQAIAYSGNKRVVFSSPTDIDLANRTPIEKQVLSSRKLEALGWKPAFDLLKAVNNTIQILRDI